MGGSGGLSADGGKLGTGGASGGSDSADGGRASGEGGAPGNTGGSNTPAGGSSSAGSDTGGDAGDGGAAGSESEPGGAAGRTSGGAGGNGTDVPELNGCTMYQDGTEPSASRTVKWDASIAFAPERCLKIRIHQEVVFDGDFDAHPLEPLGGDMPSPFSSARWAFSRPGVFGYVCSIHSEMTGAIWVVP